MKTTAEVRVVLKVLAAPREIRGLRSFAPLEERLLSEDADKKLTRLLRKQIATEQKRYLGALRQRLLIAYDISRLPAVWNAGGLSHTVFIHEEDLPRNL
jgi:hypothetical protein